MPDLSPHLQQKRDLLLDVLYERVEVWSLPVETREGLTYNTLNNIRRRNPRTIERYDEFIGPVVLDIADDVFMRRRNSFPRGFFKGFQGRINGTWAVPYLLENVLEWDDEEIMQKVDYEFFREYNLTGLRREYGDSPSLAIAATMPPIQVWQMQKLPKGFFNSKRNKRRALEWLVRKVGEEEGRKFTDEDLLPNLLRGRHFKERGLGHLLSKYFKGSTFHALDFLWPGRYRPWEFHTAPAGYWNGVDGKKHATAATRWLVEDYLGCGSIHEMEDLPGILRREDFTEAGLASITSMESSWVRLITKAYPGRFREWMFQDYEGRWTDGDIEQKVAEATRWLVGELELEETEIPGVSWSKEFNAAGLHGALTAAGNIHAAFDLAYPGKFRVWEFTVPDNYWKDAKEGKSRRVTATKWLVEDKLKTTVDRLLQNGSGRDKFTEHRLSGAYAAAGGVYKLLKEAYPDTDFASVKKVPRKVSGNGPKIKEPSMFLGETLEQKAQTAARALLAHKQLTPNDLLKKALGIPRKGFAQFGIPWALEAYDGSQTRLFMDALPWFTVMPFHFEPDYFEDDPTNSKAKLAVQWLVGMHLQMPVPDVPHKLRKPHFLEAGLGKLYAKYGNTVYAALDAFPDRWHILDFDKVPNDYWKGEKGKQRALDGVRWLFEEKLPSDEGRKIGINEIPALSSTALFRRYKLLGLLESHFSQSHIQAVMQAYPGRFKPWEFSRVPTGFWRGEGVEARVEDAMSWLLLDRLALPVRTIEAGRVPEHDLTEFGLGSIQHTLKYDWKDLMDIARGSKPFSHRLELANIQRALEVGSRRKVTEDTLGLFDFYDSIRKKPHYSREDRRLLGELPGLIARVQQGSLERIAGEILHTRRARISVQDPKIQALVEEGKKRVARTIPHWKGDGLGLIERIEKFTDTKFRTSVEQSIPEESWQEQEFIARGDELRKKAYSFLRSKFGGQGFDLDDMHGHVMQKVWESLGQFRGDGGAPLESWVFRVAYSKGLNYIAKRSNQPFSELDDQMEQRPSLDASGTLELPKQVSPDEVIDSARAMQRFGEIFRSLGSRQGAVLQLRGQEMKYGEIADELGISQATVKRDLREGRARLLDSIRSDETLSQNANVLRVLRKLDPPKEEEEKRDVVEEKESQRRPKELVGLEGQFAREFTTMRKRLRWSLQKKYGAQGFDVEDMVDRGLERAREKLDRFRGDAALHTWVHRVVHNSAIDYVRSPKNKPSYEFDPTFQARPTAGSEHVTSQIPRPDAGLHQAEDEERSLLAMERLKAIFEEINPDQVRTMQLRGSGMPYKVIAKEMGVAEGTVMSRLFYGRRKLQELIEEDRTLSNNPGVLRVLKDLNEK